MAGNAAFEIIEDYSWRAGLNNLLRADFGKWWKTRTWWTQSIIWIGTIDLLLFTIIFAERSEGGDPITDELFLLYGIFGGMFVLIGVIIMMQSAIVGEKGAGTAAWVLSKPVSRAAFILSKLISNAVGIAATAIIIPGIIAYFAFTRVAGLDITITNFIAGQGILILSALFWLVFTLMLGTLFSSRGPVIGIPMGLVFGQQFITGLVLKYVPWLYKFLPYQLVLPANGDFQGSVVSQVISGGELASWAPVYSAAILIVVFLAIGIWRFSQEEL